HAAEDDREGEAGDLRDDRGDSRMNPPDEEGQRRREDEERPGGRQEGTSLKVKTQRQRIVEGNGEGGKWQGKENAGDDGTGAAPPSGPAPDRLGPAIAARGDGLRP